IERQLLLQDEEMFFAIVPLKGLGDGLLVIFDSIISHLGDHLGIAFTLKNGAKDAEACCAGNVGDDFVKLKVHLNERLLHALNVSGSAFDEGVTLSDVT